MRLYKYLVLSNNLINSTDRYIINSKFRVDKTKRRKIDPIYPEELASYNNKLLLEVFYVLKVKLSNRRTLDLNDRTENSFLAVPKKHLNKIKPECSDEIKEINKTGTDLRLEPYFKPEYQADYLKYISRIKDYTTIRHAYRRCDNRFYLLKPYVDKPAIALMQFRYSNTSKKSFKDNNKAYVVIDFDKIRDLFELNLGVNFKHDVEDGAGYKDVFDYSRCPITFKKPCSSGVSCQDIGGVASCLGTTWSTVNSSKGTKRIENRHFSVNGIRPYKETCHYNINRQQPPVAKGETGGLAANSDGILTTTVKLYPPQEHKIVMNLHQWLSCKSISGKKKKNAPSELIHLGHTFDNRLEFIRRVYTEKIDSHLAKERVNNVFRSQYVTVGTKYLSNTLDCNCDGQKGVECQYCEGVLHVTTSLGLRALYDQLVSDDYRIIKQYTLN